MISSSQLSGLSNMINTLSNQQICDANCQNKNKIANLKKEWTKAKQNAHNVNSNLDRAERNYITAAKGSGYYSQMQESKHTLNAQKAVNEWNTEISTIWTDIDNKLNYYRGLFSYKNNVHDVYDSYKDKYETLTDNIEATRDKKNVNFRLAHFYNYNTSIVMSVLYYLKILYWLFYVIMVVLFVLKKQYINVKSWPFIIIAGLFPVLFEYGISWKNPFKNEISKISSLYETVFNNFTHFKIDNIYFIFFSLIILTILVFYFFSELSFN